MTKKQAGDDFTYVSYLRVEDLLSLQHPLSEHPDELQFIVVHQVYELWFKLALYELGRVGAAIDADDTHTATRVLGRVHRIQHLLNQQVQLLESMSPGAFHDFRGYLGTASGLQSYQFREMEVVGGLREERYLHFVEKEYAATDWPLIARHLEHPSLAERWHALLARRGVEDVLDLYAEEAATIDLFLLAEALVEFDELFVRWRYLHKQLIERTIGGESQGTGGTYATYLSSTLKYRFFPALWDVRNRLTARVNAARDET